MLPKASTLELELADFARFERKRRIARAREAYFNRFPDTLAPTSGDPEAKDNVRLPLSTLIVNKGVSFLFGFWLDFEVDGQKESPAEKWLGECLDANNRMVLLHQLGINGGIAGHCFLRVRLPDEAKTGHPYPRLSVLDPEMVDVEWEPDDCSQVVSYTYEWKTVRKENGRAVPVACRQVIARDNGRWTITDEESVGDSPVWVTVGGPDIWPYAWAPIFDCQNLPCPNEYYGLADLEESVVDLNISLNRTDSNINRILRIYAHPVMYATGLDYAVKLDTTPGKINNLGNNAGAAIHAVEMQSDLESSLEFFRELKSAFFMVTRTPEVSTGKVEDLGQISGRALEILYGPAVELTGTKRLTYGGLLMRLCRCLLEMGKQGNTHVVKPQWPAVIPKDPKADAETAIAKQESGVSRDTTLSEMGYDPEDEAEKRKQERQSDRDHAAALAVREERGGDEAEDDDEEGEGEDE